MSTKSRRGLVDEFDLRLFFGRDQGPAWLVNILNKHEREHWANRLSQLVSDINEVQKIAASEKYPTRNQLLKSPIRKRVAQILQRIDSQLAEAQFGIRLLSPIRQGWRREWLPERQEKSLAAHERVLFDIAVATVSDMAAVGELAKIRQCEYCHRWLAGRQRRHSTRFCSVDCCRSMSEQRSHQAKAGLRKGQRKTTSAPDTLPAG
jgi:hypothetical protein